MRLIVYRTLAQRRSESILGTALGFAVAFVLALVTPLPRPFLPMAVVIALFVVTSLNSKRLARAGAPRLQPEEYARRLADEIASRNAVFAISEWAVGFTLFLAGLLFLIGGAHAFGASFLPFYAFAPIAGLLVGWRRVHAARARGGERPVSAEPAFGAILLRLYVFTASGLAAGGIVAFYLPLQWRLLAVLAGLFAGLFAQPAGFRGFTRVQGGRLDWARSPIGAAGLGVVLWGLPMAMLAVAMAIVQSGYFLDASFANLVLKAGISGGIMATSGLLFGVLMWAFAKANSWSGKTQNSSEAP